MFKLRFKLNPSPGDYGSPRPHCILPRSCPIKKQMSGTIHSQVLYYMHLIQGILNCVKPLTCYLMIFTICTNVTIRVACTAGAIEIVGAKALGIALITTLTI